MKFIRNSKTIYHLVLENGITVGEVARERHHWVFHHWPQWGHHMGAPELTARARLLISDQIAVLTVTERLLK